MAVAVAATAAAAEEPAAASALPGLIVPEGAAARIVADFKRSGLTSPTALSEDAQGRWYVAETHRFGGAVLDNRNHTYWVADDVLARTVADRAAMYEKWASKFPEGFFTEKSEKIRRLEAQGDDGWFTKSEIFADGFNDPVDGAAAGILAHEGMVYLACIPSLYVLADQDGDGISDHRAVLQDGFGVRVNYSGHDLSGMTLGPDGRIWGTVGDRGLSFTTREGTPYQLPNEGAVFRFDPDGSNFELFHTGLRNPQDIVFDELGNAFTVDNNADLGDKARLIYLVDGGDSGWRSGFQTLAHFSDQVGFDEPPPVPWMEEKRWQTATAGHPEFLVPPIAHLGSGPSGMATYPGTGFLESEEGRFLMTDYTGGSAGSGIWSFGVEPEGAAMRLKDARKLVWGVTATDVEFSWDGRLMVTDFDGGWESHDAGRLIEVSALERWRSEEADEVAKVMRNGLDRADDRQLADWLGHPDMRLRIRAQLELTRRPGGFALLKEAATKGAGQARYHGIWGLGIIARRGAAARAQVEDDDFMSIPGSNQRDAALKVLVPLMDDEQPEIRVQVARVLGDAGGVGDQANFGALIRDPSPRVRFFGTIAAGRAKAMGSMSFIWEMLGESGESDPYLRHAGAEALARLGTTRQLAGLSRWDKVGVRLGAVLALGVKRDPAITTFLSDQDPRVVGETIRLIHDLNLDPARPALAEWMISHDVGTVGRTNQRRLLINALKTGNSECLERVYQLAMAKESPPELRKEAMWVIGAWDDPWLVDPVTGEKLEWNRDDRASARQLIESRLEEWLNVGGKELDTVINALNRLGVDDGKVPDEWWTERIKNDHLPEDARLAVLGRWEKRKPEGEVDVLDALAGSKNDRVATHALKRLAKLAPSRAFGRLREATESEVVLRRQAGWQGLGNLDAEGVDQMILEGLEKLAADPAGESAALELLAAAGKRDAPAVKAGLERFEKSIGSSDDPLAQWLVCLEGGNAKQGKEVFRRHQTAQCMKCHRLDDEDKGSEAGPALHGVAKRGDRRFLLESLVTPGARVSPGFGVVMVTLKDGSTVAGILMAEDEEGIEVAVGTDRQRIDRDRIKEVGLPLSPMPPMGGILSKAEIRDLVEWLSELDREDED